MLLHLPDVLIEETLREVRSTLEQQELTAARFSLPALATRITEALYGHPIFMMAAQPKLLAGVVFHRHRENVDQLPIVNEGIVHRPQPIRVDLRALVFLSDVSEYDGGEAVLKLLNQDEVFNGPAGSCLLFPAGTPIGRRGVRKGAVWTAELLVQSTIRNASEREILYDISYSRELADLLTLTNKEEIDRLRFCETELLRGWAEI